MKRLRTVRALAAIAGLALLLAGCAGSNAALRNSREVGHAFEVLHAYPNYSYWYLNQENNPFGVVGLEKGYSIQDKMWTPVDPASKTFEKVVGLVQSFPVPGGFTYGAYIIDPGGQTIGVWYSSMGAGIRIDRDEAGLDCDRHAVDRRPRVVRHGRGGRRRDRRRGQRGGRWYPAGVLGRLSETGSV